MAFNPNQPRDPHGRFGEVAAHAAAAIANVVSATGNAATVARAISAVLKQGVAKGGALDLTRFISHKLPDVGKHGWLQKKSKEWLGGTLLNSGEREDVLKYSDDSHVNKILRGLVDIEEAGMAHAFRGDDAAATAAIDSAMIAHQSHVMGLDSAIAKSRTTEDVHLYRGVGTPNRYGLPGEIYHDHGFVSTSFDQEKAMNFSKNRGMAHIYIRKGLKALVLDGYSEHSTEGEALLPRDSKFRVLHYSEDGRHVHLEALGDE